jgi:hypothetical protein
LIVVYAHNDGSWPQRVAERRCGSSKWTDIAGDPNGEY